MIYLSGLLLQIFLAPFPLLLKESDFIVELKPSAKYHRWRPTVSDFLDGDRWGAEDSQLALSSEK